MATQTTPVALSALPRPHHEKLVSPTFRNTSESLKDKILPNTQKSIFLQTSSQSNRTSKSAFFFCFCFWGTQCLCPVERVFLNPRDERWGKGKGETKRVFFCMSWPKTFWFFFKQQLWLLLRPPSLSIFVNFPFIKLIHHRCGVPLEYAIASLLVEGWTWVTLLLLIGKVLLFVIIWVEVLGGQVLCNFKCEHWHSVCFLGLSLFLLLVTDLPVLVPNVQ